MLDRYWPIWLAVVVLGLMGLYYGKFSPSAGKTRQTRHIVAFRVAANGSEQHTQPLVWHLEFRCRNMQAMEMDIYTPSDALDVVWPSSCDKRARVKVSLGSNRMGCRPHTERWITIARPDQASRTVPINMHCD